MLDSLFELSQEFLQIKNQTFQRYFIKETILSERMSILVGQRGVGKTTLIIQYLLAFVQQNRFSPKILYIQADHYLLGQLSLYEIAENFYQMGGEFIAIDEIHKYLNWSQELKSIYDTFPKLKIIASGSSALEIHKGSHDLTRRAIVYNIAGLSLREWIFLQYNIELPHYDLATVLANHQEITTALKIIIEKHTLKILPLFKEYLQIGFYPFYQELQDPIKYAMILEQNIHTTLEADLPAIYPELSNYSITKIKQLLIFISQNVPFTPNWSNVKNAISVADERTVKNYFKYLNDAELIFTVYKASKQLQRGLMPAKVYLQNPNLMKAISNNKDNSGTIREIFFCNMLAKKHNLTAPEAGDFLVDDNLTFEIGGRKKGQKQIKHATKGFIVADDVETGFSNKIPLWLLGFLY